MSQCCKSDQLFVCFGGSNKGVATMKQWMLHWVKGATCVSGTSSPLGVQAHSTRGVAPSQALSKDAALEDTCVAAGWASLHTFIRFDNLDVDFTLGSQVLFV